MKIDKHEVENTKYILLAQTVTLIIWVPILSWNVVVSVSYLGSRSILYVLLKIYKYTKAFIEAFFISSV